MSTIGKRIELLGIDKVEKDYDSIDVDKINILVNKLRVYMYSLVLLLCSFAFICVSYDNISTLWLYLSLLFANFVLFVVILRKFIKKNNNLNDCNYKVETLKTLLEIYKKLLNTTFLYFEKKEDEFENSLLYLNYIDMNGVKQQIDMSEFIIYNTNNNNNTIEINLESKSILMGYFDEMEKKTEEKYYSK